MPLTSTRCFSQSGGGGLISGVAMAVKSLRPSVRVIGVEPEVADDALRSRQAGQGGANFPATDDCRRVATQAVGQLTFR